MFVLNGLRKAYLPQINFYTHFSTKRWSTSIAPFYQSEKIPIAVSGRLFELSLSNESAFICTQKMLYSNN